MHAPAPWKVNARSLTKVIDGVGITVAQAFDSGGNGDTAKANATLIVQAVNAHERLKDALALIVGQLGVDFDMTDDDRVSEQLAQAYMNARTLLEELEPQDTHEARR